MRAIRAYQRPHSILWDAKQLKDGSIRTVESFKKLKKMKMRFPFMRSQNGSMNLLIMRPKMHKYAPFVKYAFRTWMKWSSCAASTSTIKSAPNLGFLIRSHVRRAASANSFHPMRPRNAIMILNHSKTTLNKIQTMIQVLKIEYTMRSV